MFERQLHGFLTELPMMDAIALAVLAVLVIILYGT
jgi:hypothetical protein